MSAVGKALVVVGGTVITAGVVWLWLREHPIVTTCEDITNESECIDAGCYWYNNKCHSTPEAPPGTHYDCIKDPMTGLIMCAMVEGEGVNKCDPFAPPDYCWKEVPCTSDRDCGVGAKCWDGRCYWTATPPNVQSLDWEGTHVEQIRFDFEKRIIGNKVMGSVIFTLDPWNVGCTPHLKVYLIRDGKRIKTIYDRKHEGLDWAYGDPVTRPDSIVIFHDAEAVDGIEFWCKCDRGFPYYSHSFVLTGIHCQLLYI